MNRALPESRIIRPEDIFGKGEPDANISKLIQMVNRQTEYIHGLLEGRLIIGSHVQAQIQEITAYDPEPLTLTPPIFYRFKRTIQNKARAVLLGKCAVNGSPTTIIPIAGASFVSWHEEDGEILITYLPGFTVGTKYDITLVVL